MKKKRMHGLKLLKKNEMDLYTHKRNRNATLFQWKIDGVVVKVLDRDNEPSSFQQMPRN